MLLKGRAVVLWLTLVVDLVQCSARFAAANSTTEAIGKAGVTLPLASKTSTPTIAKTTAKSTAKSTAKGINPALASALADLMAKGGSDSPEANALGAIMGIGGGGRPFAPAMAPAPMALGAGFAGANKGLPRGPYPTRTGPPRGATPANIESITGSGDPSMYSCWQTHMKYNHETYSFFNASGKAISTTWTIPSSTMTTVFHNTSIPTSTGCDGYARVMGETNTPVTLTFTDASMVTQRRVFPGPTPTCSIPDYQCHNAYSAFESASFSYISSAYFSFFLDSAHAKTLPNVWFGHVQPPCTSIQSCPAPSESATCTIDAERATVFYWPVTTVGDLCARGPIATATGAVDVSKPTTAVYGNVTVTSPSALVVLRSVVASQHPKVTVSPVPEYLPMARCGARVNATLLVAPSALSTIRTTYTPTYVDTGRFTGYRASTVPYSFNFADMNPGAVPWDAYVAPLGCNIQSKESHNCPSTILPTYSPLLSLPNSAKEVGINGEFASCIPGRVHDATYVPITAAKLEMPSRTYYGAKVSVAPKFSSIQAAAQARIVMADATITPMVVPWTDEETSEKTSEE